MNRAFNFSAGPSMLPLDVLQKAEKEFVNYGTAGMSVMEMSHRSKAYEEIIYTAEENLKKLMKVPDNYSILFLQGGGSTQFAMVPMNLMTKNKTADFVQTGQWATKAIEEAGKFGTANIIASSKNQVYNYIPDLTNLPLTPNTDYLHLTVNNTIYGTHIPNENLPETGNIPLVADMSSNILAEEYDINKFGIVYAGAQKNLGPAGLTIAIVRNDLMGAELEFTPTMLKYATHAKERSMYNTPPTYSIYFAGLVFQWVLSLGGVAEMEKLNKEKANILYDFLDNSEFFKGTVVPKDRSLMNVPFILPTDQLNADFLKEAETKGFVNLAGHRTVGGMRASIYNAMPLDGVKALVDLMKDFQHKNK